MLPSADAPGEPVTDPVMQPICLDDAIGGGRATLVVFGRKDWPYTQDLLAHLDDAAHFLADDAPAEVAALVLDWIGRG